MNLDGDFARIEAEALGLSVGEGEIFAIHIHGGRALDIVGEINAVALGDSESSFQVDCERAGCESGGGRFSGFTFKAGMRTCFVTDFPPELKVAVRVALADAMKQERAMSEMNLIEVTFRSYAMMAKEEKSASGGSAGDALVKIPAVTWRAPCGWCCGCCR